MPVIYHGHTLTTKIPFKVRPSDANAASCALRPNYAEFENRRRECLAVIQLFAQPVTSLDAG